MPWPIRSGTINKDFCELSATLKNYYGFDNSNLFFQLEATRDDLHRTLIDWLASKSNYGDLVFIFLAAHGGGWNGTGIEGGRIDVDGDEGPEVYNATSGEWFGVDECLYFDRDGSLYWDDELKQDLANIKYGRMIIFIVGCKSENATEGCFSGGFIDDISGPRRIVITSANETWYSYGRYFERTRFFLAIFC